MANEDFIVSTRRLGWMFLSCLALAPLALLAGCGNSGIAEVSGTVTLDGKPLPNATVEFYPENEGRSSAGRTDDSGFYELHYDRASMGASVGEHKVVIQTGGGDVQGDYGAIAREVLPAKYNVNTELVASVTGGSNTIDFPLDSEGEVIQPPGVEGGRY